MHVVRTCKQIQPSSFQERKQQLIREHMQNIAGYFICLAAYHRRWDRSDRRSAQEAMLARVAVTLFLEEAAEFWVVAAAPAKTRIATRARAVSFMGPLGFSPVSY
jgi:hypothetical protein